MWYVGDVIYAVLYVRFSCFVIRGCAVSRRYINVCNSDVFSVVNMYLICTSNECDEPQPTLVGCG